MKLLKTLYAKIFAWFWLTLVVGATIVSFFTFFTGTPFGQRWMSLTQDLYAHSAIDFYDAGGTPALHHYLDALKESSGIQAQLLDPSLHDVEGKPLLSHVMPVLQKSLNKHASSVRLRRIWTASSPIRYRGKTYIFVMQVEPFSGFVNGTFARPILIRFLLAFAVAGFFCLVLTRHLVAPIREMQHAAQRIAGGDLASRVHWNVTAREDELGDTASAFNQMADAMELLLRKRQELLADISHELRSPLTRISVSLELMRRGADDVLEKMQVDIDRMNAMIAQLLLLSRVDMQTKWYPREKIYLTSMLEQIVEDACFEGKKEGKHVTLLSPLSCYVRGDANLLRSAIENVVRNALRYTPPQSSISLNLQQKSTAFGNICEMHITDQGPGVPEELLHFIFDPFFRAPESRRHEDGGVGLGLSIAQRVVQMHGGVIHAQNTRAGGLRVSIELPLLEEV